MTQSIALLTYESVEEVLDKGGTGFWVTKADRADQYPFAVLVRNRKHPKAPSDVPHRSAFLIGKISGAEEHKFSEGKTRTLIRFDQYAVLDSEIDAWGDSQNPVWYTTLETVGVKLGDLKFRPMPNVREIEPEAVSEKGHQLGSEDTLTILMEAKATISLRTGVALGKIRVSIEV